jgi:molecular chaperone GrpE (heat shock protein)
MFNSSPPKLSKWPFFLGDLVLFGCAFFVFFQSVHPMGPWQIGFVVFCVAGSACLALLPFLLEYRVLAKMAEANAALNALNQFKNLEAIAAQLNSACSQSELTHSKTESSLKAANDLSERMSTELRAFGEFMQRANDSEKGNLRLEVEKLRRSEADWLQVTVRMLDHIFALNQGAMRSGQPNLINQMASFQNACREAARRVGLVPYIAESGEPFDDKKHQVMDGASAPISGAAISETVATGYTFQGRLLRPVVVRMAAGVGSQKTEPAVAVVP